MNHSLVNSLDKPVIDNILQCTYFLKFIMDHLDLSESSKASLANKVYVELNTKILSAAAYGHMALPYTLQIISSKEKLRHDPKKGGIFQNDREVIGPDELRIKELVGRIKQDEIKEVALATNTNVEGEATASYLAQVLKGYPVKVTRIATGVPVGGDLKYLDGITLRRAMERRESI